MLRYVALSDVMRRYAPIRKGKRSWFSSSSNDPWHWREDYAYWGGCQQRYCRKGGFQISKWFPHRGFGDNVSQTPWWQTLFQSFINEIRTATADAKDTVKGELVFRGKVGQHIEEKGIRKTSLTQCFGIQYGESRGWLWIPMGTFFCFGKEREAWLQPGVRVDAKGEISLSAYNGKLNVSCKVEELVQYVADSSNSNQ